MSAAEDKKKPSVEHHHMASPYYERESAQYLPTYIGSKGGFGPCGEMSKPNAHLGPKRFHMAFESWKLAQYSSRYVPDKFGPNGPFILVPKCPEGPSSTHFWK